nr:glycosyl hydrolase 53 family protein [Bacteroidota bacterium]
MKLYKLIPFLGIAFLMQCNSPTSKTSEFDAVSHVETGIPVSVMLTSYSTTLLADGSDHTRLRIAVTDSTGREITSATDSIQIYVTEDGSVTAADGSDLVIRTDTLGTAYAECQLMNGLYHLLFISGTEPDKIKVEARSGKLWPGAHEIHTLPVDFVMMKPKPDQLPSTTKTIDRMIGADISFLPQIEDRGRKFFVNDEGIDAIELLRNHGFNYIRLRIFVNPENEKGYAPEQGYCGLKYTLEMARRIRDGGMKLLLDFHYSDYWADPQQQYKPLAWADLDFETLKDSVKAYTTNVLLALKQQGTLPDMVQIGNEINHGILWPDGHISRPDQLAGLLKAGVEGVEAVNPDLPVMMHIALGGQKAEAVFWLDNMIARGVQFDIIGISYYPRWHGTLYDLKSNLHDLAKRYNKPLNVVEYSDFKREVHDIVFNLPGNLGKGTCIWEPLGWRSGMFDRNGEVTELISVYDGLKEKYLTAPE